MVPHKWDNSKLDLCISIGELVKPLHNKKIKIKKRKNKKSFLKILFLLPHLLLIEIMFIFFKNSIQDMCDDR